MIVMTATTNVEGKIFSPVKRFRRFAGIEFIGCSPEIHSATKTQKNKQAENNKFLLVISEYIHGS